MSIDVRAGLAGLLLGLSAGPLAAAQVESVTVDKVDGRYHIDMHVQMDVPAEQAYAVFTDFEHLARINPAVTAATMPAPDVLRTVIDSCVLIFCMAVEQVQSVRLQQPGEVHLNVLPDESDWRYGELHYDFQPDGQGGTHMRMTAELEPDFWVPPIIGTWLVRRKLENEAEITSTGIERVAGERFQ